MQALLTPPETLLGILVGWHLFEPPIIKLINLEDALYVETILETIPLATVWLHATSTDLHVTYSNKGPLASDRTSQGSFTALPGMVYLVASKASAHKVNTGVLFAVLNPTMLSNAPSSHELFVISTPFVPEEWHKLLLNIASFNDISNLPNSICSSFNMGVTSPPSFTYTPPNHNSAIHYPTHVSSHIHNELLNRRYTGPFSCSRLEFLIGPFCTSPLGTVLKVGSLTKQRVIQNLSFPRNDPFLSSINDGIDPDLFTCNWGTLKPSFLKHRLILKQLP